eukprot:TRINITY_DN29445_c0_g1_i1.p1 TRINITY_DN29445_c0_g1~~TRINITY_DN29445_c0_g1_i1.p1  ORF type:complete len:335 (-),score=63.83 TRINITY_DN29445_c0_g1_i1:75-1079(-)
MANHFWKIGKKVTLWSLLVSSLSFLAPPLLIFSAIGLAFAMPLGCTYGSYVCLKKLLRVFHGNAGSHVFPSEKADISVKPHPTRGFLENPSITEHVIAAPLKAEEAFSVKVAEHSIEGKHLEESSKGDSQGLYAESPQDEEDQFKVEERVRKPSFEGESISEELDGSPSEQHERDSERISSEEKHQEQSPFVSEPSTSLPETATDVTAEPSIVPQQTENDVVAAEVVFEGDVSKAEEAAVSNGAGEYQDPIILESSSESYDVQDINSEDKIWKEIHEVRKIVGYTEIPLLSYAEELKALYVFTGVQPSPFLEECPNILKARKKLELLKVLIGIK